MSNRQKLLSGKPKYIIALLLLVLISLVFFVNTNSDFDISRREVLLRRIGHEILLQSGDSTSRVLPVKKIAENEYQISFEKEFSFVTDSLVNTTKRLLAKDYQVSDYVVSVINCDNSSVAYGYAISKNKKEDILACVGRKQPIACYKINIKFKPSDVVTANYKYYLGSFAFLLLIGFVFWKIKSKKQLPKFDNNKLFTFGSVLFDAQKRQL